MIHRWNLFLNTTFWNWEQIPGKRKCPIGDTALGIKNITNFFFNYKFVHLKIAVERKLFQSLNWGSGNTWWDWRIKPNEDIIFHFQWEGL